MGISTVVFSRDRAAQLDLLLASLELNAASILAPTEVLWRAGREDYEDAYRVCAAAHPEARFAREWSFAAQVHDSLEGDGSIVFFTDDSVLFRPLDSRPKSPQAWLEREEVLCLSLRLGRNCSSCYPLARAQSVPAFAELDAETLAWEWRGADGDFGYPGSLDGHVFRKADLRELLAGAEFTNPNTLESALADRVGGSHRETAACYASSHLVGIPVNRVNDTHPNRFGEMWPFGADVLNERYLEGARLELASLRFDEIDGAHAELPLRFGSGT